MSDLSVVVCLALDPHSSCDGLAKFKECICRCPFVETTLEVSGTFDLIVQGHCDSLAEYSRHVESIQPAISRFVTRIETNFVCRRVDQDDFAGDKFAVWLPCRDGHKRVEVRLIDKILAEGDYMRVHVGEWQCLVHSTMRRFCEHLGSSKFMQIHRSTLVRIDFIERLVHDARGWKARLRDGTVVNVAKSHVKKVLQLVAGEAPELRDISSQNIANSVASGKDEQGAGIDGGCTVMRPQVANMCDGSRVAKLK